MRNSLHFLAMHFPVMALRCRQPPLAHISLLLGYVGLFPFRENLVTFVTALDNFSLQPLHRLPYSDRMTLRRFLWVRNT